MTCAVTVITDIPSPYQVELFDALDADGRVALRVIYLRRGAPDRQWSARCPGHVHQFLDAAGDRARCLDDAMASADLVVFGAYRDADVRDAMARRANAGAWCFWGERPGARRTGILGVGFRRVALAPLHRVPVPIWGMGSWAIDGYRAEFGQRRRYFNVPYFSDLERFAPGKRTASDERRLLYSGSLITRKGVDLLAEAFARVAVEHSALGLTVLGAGPLETRMRHRLESFGERVRFLGFRDWEELPRIYAQADALAAPSRHDGWGLIVPEALAAGLPVIATDRMGAAVDLIEHGTNGWCVRAGDADALANALTTLARLDADALAAASSAAVRSVSGHRLSDGVERFIETTARTLEAQP